MTVARNSQTVAEVLATSGAPVARTSQVVAETLLINTGVVIRASQVVVEALRPYEPLSTARTSDFFALM